MTAASTTPSLAFNDADATAINHKNARVQFYMGLSESYVRNINGQPAEIACKNVRSAKVYTSEAAPLAAEVLKLIGPDMFGEYKDIRAKMTGAIQIDKELADLMADCPAG